MNALLKRTLSGIVFITLVSGATLLSGYTMLLLILVIFSISFKEFREMFEQTNGGLFAVLLISGQVMLVLSFLVFSNMVEGRIMTFIGIGTLTFLILYFLFTTACLSELSILFLGLIWIGGSSILFIGTGFAGNSQGYSEIFPMILFILVWINDVSAYLFGSRIGKNQLAPRISPGKTWEGFIGGVVLTSIAGWGVFRFTSLYTPAFWLITGVLISLAATAGDLFESKVKREAGVKDSGNVIPGHGGLLDRFDSLLFSAPVFYMVITIINWLS